MINSRFRCTALLVLVAFSITSLDACSNQGSKGSVTVLGPWTRTEPGDEGHAFGTVLDAFTAKTGIQVDYQDTRALSQVVLSNVKAGTPPDVAVLSSPGELAKYARDGQLHPLNDVIDEGQQAAFRKWWLLPQRKDGIEHIYTVPVKANLKSIIWFNPTRTPRPTFQTLDDLLEYNRPMADTETASWCMGMGDTPNSGWPGSDLIEGIFLHKFGPKLYQQWAHGKLSWTSNQVKEAWTTWGKISVNAYGGPPAALLTDFRDAGRPMFTDPPGCLLEHEASFIMGFYQRYKDLPSGVPQPGTDFDFFPFPAASNQNSGRSWEASADLAGMFNDTTQAKQLMQFLATNEAQQIWPDIHGGSAFVVNKNVDPIVYDDEVSKRIAEILRSDDTLCFDAADLMPATMRNAFYRAVLEYLNDPNQLDTILRSLDGVQTRIPSEDWLDLPCD